MGHDHHFLERLDRIATPQVEFALSLYRDAPLVRRVLETARIGESAERVAIALADGERSAHIIVARDGGFVTCLAEGMSPAPWPVIKRTQLDVIATKVNILRERVETAQRLAGPGGEVSRLLHRIYLGGPHLSREEFTGIAAFQPLMAREFLALVLKTGVALIDAQDAIAATDRKYHRLTAAEERLLRAYWNSFWALGHLFMLTTMEGPEVLSEPLLEALRDNRGTLSWALVRQTQMPLALRAAWGVGRLGKPLLRIYKTRYAEAQSYLQAVDAGLCLTAIGHRHEKLRAEVLKAMASQPLTSTEHLTGLPRLVNATRAVLATHVEFRTVVASAQKAGTIGELPSLGARAWVRFCEQNPDVELPHRASAPEQVPGWLALAFLPNVVLSFARPRDGVLPAVIYALEAAACARAEELYLPREVASRLATPWTPDQTLELVAPLVADRKRKPMRAEKTPGRNDPCSCGSAKKYKRCCGAAA